MKRFAFNMSPFAFQINLIFAFTARRMRRLNNSWKGRKKRRIFVMILNGLLPKKMYASCGIKKENIINLISDNSMSLLTFFELFGGSYKQMLLYKVWDYLLSYSSTHNKSLQTFYVRFLLFFSFGLLAKHTTLCFCFVYFIG